MVASVSIAGAGISCLDQIVRAPQVNWGETGAVSEYFVQGGGLVATAMVACARLGACCELFSPLGDDFTGQEIAKELVSEKVHLRLPLTPGGKSPFSFIHIDEHSGERTIFHRSSVGLATDLKKVDFSVIATCGALLVDDIYPDMALAAAKAARAAGVPVVADLIPNEKNRELLQSVDVLIAPRHYAQQLGLTDNLDAALAAIHRLGPTTAVIPLGTAGWVFSDPTGTGRGAAFPVEVVDTNGAGDTFHGAFAFGLAQGWETARCAEFAAAAAALKCTRLGGRTGLPTLAQAIAFLKARSTQKWEL